VHQQRPHHDDAACADEACHGLGRPHQLLDLSVGKHTQKMGAWQYLERPVRGGRVVEMDS